MPGHAGLRESPDRVHRKLRSAHSWRKAAKIGGARAAVFREAPVEVVATPPMLIAAGIEAVMDLGYGAFWGSACRKTALIVPQ